MKDFITNILPKIKVFSKRIDDETILKNQHWILLDDRGLTSTTYIFRDKNQLLVSIDGDVTIGTWEYLTNDKLLINLNNKMLLYRNQYFDDKILTLKKDGSEIYSVLINDKYSNINKIEEFLIQTYLIKVNKIESSSPILATTIKSSTDLDNSKQKNQDDILKTMFFIFLFISLMGCLYYFSFNT